jgi:hypothetical protein
MTLGPNHIAALVAEKPIKTRPRSHPREIMGEPASRAAWAFSLVSGSSSASGSGFIMMRSGLSTEENITLF